MFFYPGIEVVKTFLSIFISKKPKMSNLSFRFLKTHSPTDNPNGGKSATTVGGKSFVCLFLMIAGGACSRAVASPCPPGPLHLERTPFQKVKAKLELVVHPQKKKKSSPCEVFVCVPPTLEQQREIDFKVYSDAGLAGKLIHELSPLKRPMMSIQIPASGVHDRVVTASLSAMLYRIKLVPGAPSVAVAPLPPGERTRSLVESPTLDFRSVQFQKWLDTTKLRKKASESQLEFAWRTFEQLRESYRYYWDFKLDRRISRTCQANASDCAGLSYLLCGILRANNIPARPLIGRIAKTTKTEETRSNPFSCHVKAEFFIDKLGWVPADISKAIDNPRRSSSLYFGSEPGTFVVLHESTDLIVNSAIAGKQTIRSLPDFRCWTKGEHGPLTNTSLFWTVERESLVRRYPSSPKQD